MSSLKTNTIDVVGEMAVARFVGVTEINCGGGGGGPAVLKLPETVASSWPAADLNRGKVVTPGVPGGFKVQITFVSYGQPIEDLIVNVRLSELHVPDTGRFVG